MSQDAADATCGSYGDGLKVNQAGAVPVHFRQGENLRQQFLLAGTPVIELNIQRRW